MKVDNVLILAAGKGTRMGQIGKILPKVIWPIFNKSILELEVAYARQFNPNKIYINLFNSKEIILNQVKDLPSFKDVEFIIEESVLDIGGAVHNLATKLEYKENLLILNSDQFIVLSEKKLEDFDRISQKSDTTLLVYSVDPRAGYGGLKIQDDKAIGLISKSEAINLKKLVTYTGMCLIKLEKLNPQTGKSNFFESVINFDSMSPSIVNVDDCEYWDFGTLERYKNSLKKIKSSDDKFIGFLKQSGVKFKENDSIVDDQISLTDTEIIFKN